MRSLLSKAKKFVKKYQTSQVLKNQPSTAFPRVTKDQLVKIMDGNAYIHDDEIALFAELAQASSGPIVEIGAAFGASSAVFLLHSKVGVQVRSIDPFVVDSMSSFFASEKRCRKNVSTLLNIFGKEGRYKDWQVFPDFSFNVVKNWVDPIDLLFIDGDHTYDAVKKDFEDWYPLVKTGGHIMIHDSRKEPGTPQETFNRGWPGPTQLASELRSSPKVQLVREAFSVTVWKKL